MRRTYIWYCVAYICTLVGAEVSTSTYKLAIVCNKEGQLLEELDRYVTLMLNNSSRVDEPIQRFLRKVKDERSNITNTEDWIDHPINAYHLVKRTALDWWDVQQSINCSSCVLTAATVEFLSSWTRITDKNGIWTNNDDLTIAVCGLARLVETYNLDFTTLMSGTILNITTTPLTIDDALKIVIHLSKEHKIKWIEALIDTGLVKGNEDSLLYELGMTYHLVGKSNKGLRILTDLQKTSTRSMNGIINIIRQEAQGSADGAPRHQLPNPNEELNKVYRVLCRGHAKKRRDAARLKCYNKVTQMAYYTGKEEVLHHIPRISRFHDVISDTEILQLMETAKQNLRPAEIVQSTGKTKSEYKSRTGERCGIDPTLNVSVTLERRAQMLTGLDPLKAEQFEVMNYGLGGQYLRHFDSLDLQRIKTIDRNYEHRDRIATWMFYLSDVEAGGATVFPVLNLRVPPVKGSAVFWYNLLPSGERDERSQHASCPVLMGSKWIATKWILEYGQEFRRPCKLNPREEHD